MPVPQEIYTRACMCILALEYRYRVTADTSIPDSVFDELQRGLLAAHDVPGVTPHPNAPVPGYSASDLPEDFPRSVRRLWSGEPAEGAEWEVARAARGCLDQLQALAAPLEDWML